MKTTKFILLIIVFASISCKNSQRNEFSQKDFKIDTVKIIDKNNHLEIFLTIPNSNIKGLDSFIRKDILNDKDEFVKDVSERIAENTGEMSVIGSDYSCILESTHIDQNFISYNFVNSQYFAGSAHGISRFKSYNFNLKKNRIINFNEYFILKNRKDSLFLMNLLTKRINREMVEVNTLENIDYNITKDSISFNFDNYQISSYAEGLIQTKIAKSEIKQFINNNYR